MDFDFQQTCFTEKCQFDIPEIVVHQVVLDENIKFLQLAFAGANATSLYLDLFDLSYIVTF